MADSEMYYGTVPFLHDAPLTEEHLVSRFKCEPWISFGRMAMSDPRIMHCFVERTRPQRVFCIEGNWYLGLTDEDRPAVIMEFEPEPVRDEVAVLRGLTLSQASAGRIDPPDVVGRFRHGHGRAKVLGFWCRIPQGSATDKQDYCARHLHQGMAEGTLNGIFGPQVDKGPSYDTHQESLGRQPRKQPLESAA